jgi:hypothetical protein
VVVAAEAVGVAGAAVVRSADGHDQISLDPIDADLTPFASYGPSRPGEVEPMILRRLVLLLACATVLSVTTARAADEPDEDMPGRIVLIRPSSQLFKFVSKAVTEFALPAAANDPTVEGGSLTVFDGGSVQSDTYALPAGGWKALGTPVKGYKYKGAGSLADPCRVVLVKKRVAKAVCKGAGVTVTTPFVGEVGIVVTLGTDSKRYCVRFGGNEAKNDATLLKRRDAPAVASSCPAPAPTPTTTTTLPSCGGPLEICGSCGVGGFCAAHIDPGPPPNVCVDTMVCSPGACASDADCSGGQACVQNPLVAEDIVCCTPCP